MYTALGDDAQGPKRGDCHHVPQWGAHLGCWGRLKDSEPRQAEWVRYRLCRLETIRMSGRLLWPLVALHTHGVAETRDPA